ncbi:MAG: hypothetical protein NVSMB28_28920 [Collimonas sp.]
MKALFILNTAPYGHETTYNALRLVGALSKRDHNTVRIYLMGDAVGAARHGQKVPEGYYNLELMLQKVLHQRGDVGVCGTCMDVRALQATELIEGIHRGTLDELADWTEWADQVLTF